MSQRFPGYPNLVWEDTFAHASGERGPCGLHCGTVHIRAIKEQTIAGAFVPSRQLSESAESTSTRCRGAVLLGRVSYPLRCMGVISGCLHAHCHSPPARCTHGLYTLTGAVALLSCPSCRCMAVQQQQGHRPMACAAQRPCSSPASTACQGRHQARLKVHTHFTS